MNKHSIKYLESNDIDFFFIANGRIYHCATNGSLIPEECREIIKLNNQKNFFRGLNSFCESEDLAYNQEFLEHYYSKQKEIYDLYNNKLSYSSDSIIQISRELIISNYISSFRFYAERGIISCDYLGPIIIEKKHTAEQFIVVASPQKEIPLKMIVSNEIIEEIGILDLSAKFISEGETLNIII